MCSGPRWTRLLSVFFLFFVGDAYAGGGPENVLLVVNSADHDSLTIANYYLQLRKVPPSNVLRIAWPRAPFVIDLPSFRTRILQPVLKAIEQRHLSAQIDYIVYSSGFPYAVDFSNEREATSRSPSVGSLTGLTFHYQEVLDNSTEFVSTFANNYARNGVLNGGPSMGFRSQYDVDLSGLRVRRGNGDRYYLSMMLGYTKGDRNNTLKEISTYLQRGVQADGTHPKGTVYFVRNNNVRSLARHGSYESTIEELQSMNIAAELIDGKPNDRDVLPVKKKDVLGAMVGFYKVAWASTESECLPGAICDNFTSYGGVLSGEKNQTLLSHFLRHGAVASSGTVVEPLATPAKFPHPRIHVHYTRGCTVAEAFYQSVLSPYQLLIVGDPLCQPFASAPKVRITGLQAGTPLSGIVELQVEIESETGHRIRNLNVFIDGRLFSQELASEPIRIDTRRLADGYHELRVVAIEDTSLETHGGASVSFNCVNLPEGDDGPVDDIAVIGELAQRPPGGKFMANQGCIVRVRSSGAREIRLYRGRDILGATSGASGRIEMNTASLGSGRVKVTPIAFPANTKRKPVIGRPLEINIDLPNQRRR